MKTIGASGSAKLTLLALVCLGLFALVWIFLSDGDGIKNSEPAFAKVVQLRGEVLQLMTPDDAEHPLATGDLLPTGATIKTGAQSSMTLQFADQSLLLIADNSLITLQALLRSKNTDEVETVIRVDTGSIESRVKKQTGFKPSYRVITPALQLSVRGTVFLVKVDKLTGRSSSTVIEGTVMATSGGKEVQLLAGFGTVAEVGEPPAEPSAVLILPVLEAVRSPTTRLPLNLSWSPLTAAVGYRVQLLGGPTHEYLIHDQIYPSGVVAIRNLPDAEYLLRVRGIDEKGLEGQSAEQNFVLAAHPLSPQTKAPLNGDIVARKKVLFRWDISPEADGYLLQVSDKGDFSNIVKQVPNLPGSIAGISIKLPPGEYLWRVSSLTADGKQGPFSEKKKFSVVAHR